MDKVILSSNRRQPECVFKDTGDGTPSKDGKAFKKNQDNEEPSRCRSRAPQTSRFRAPQMKRHLAAPVETVVSGIDWYPTHAVFRSTYPLFVTDQALLIGDKAGDFFNKHKSLLIIPRFRQHLHLVSHRNSAYTVFDLSYTSES